METYRKMKKRHQAEVDAFPMFAAFSETQMTKGLKKLGLDPDKGYKDVMSIGAGCYIRKTDEDAFLAMMNRHKDERQQGIDADPDGTGFIFQMFRTELSYYEYSFTEDVSDTLEALGLTVDDVNASPALLNGLDLACKACIAEDEP